MKKRLLYISMVMLFSGIVAKVSAQENSNFDAEFTDVDQELIKWDPIRGKWLGNSLKAMSANEPIPDRTFPEDFSPAEMMRMVPATTITNVRNIAQSQSQNSRDLLARDRWERITNYTNRPTCQLVMGRTYGDPHLKSFDGASYSFQTVGEFVLSTANNNSFEVQVRQEPQSDDFSLNTAIAMQVGGDRLGIYTQDNRNGLSSPVMLNGMPLSLGVETYYLPYGGTIVNSGKNYLVTWPTGEKVSIDISRTGGMSFMNIAVQIYPCASNRYAGLLGNANGNRNDDFNTGRDGGAMSGVFAGGGSRSQDMEKERLAFLAKDFANAFRITPQTSLFDYRFGESTMAFTDYSYPRVHRTLHDIPTGRRTTARNTCAANGLSGDELDACIFDQAFLDLPPVRPPVIRDRTDRVNLPRIDRESPNVNVPREIVPVKALPADQETIVAPEGTVTTKPMEVNQKIDEIKTEQVPIEHTTPSQKWDAREVQERTIDEKVQPVKASPSTTSGKTSSERETQKTTPESPSKPTRSEPKVLSPKPVQQQLPPSKESPSTAPIKSSPDRNAPAKVTPVKKESKPNVPAPPKSSESGAAKGVKRGG